MATPSRPPPHFLGRAAQPGASRPVSSSPVACAYETASLRLDDAWFFAAEKHDSKNGEEIADGTRNGFGLGPD